MKTRKKPQKSKKTKIFYKKGVAFIANMWYNSNVSSDFSQFGRKTGKKQKTKKFYIKGELES